MQTAFQGVLCVVVALLLVASKQNGIFCTLLCTMSEGKKNFKQKVFLVLLPLVVSNKEGVLGVVSWLFGASKEEGVPCGRQVRRCSMCFVLFFALGSTQR